MLRNAFFVVWMLLGTLACFADVFQVTLDTTPLIDHPAEPFSISFALLDGSGTGDGNTTIVLSNFSFGGGAPAGPALAGLGATGDLSSTVTLNDSVIESDFSQEFLQGSQFTFSMDVSHMPSPGDDDLFVFQILDSALQPIPTLDSSGEDALLIAVINSSGVVFTTFTTDPNTEPLAAGPPIIMGPPVVTVVPEPSSLLLLGAGVTLLGLALRNRRRTTSGAPLARRRHSG